MRGVRAQKTDPTGRSGTIRSGTTAATPTRAHYGKSKQATWTWHCCAAFAGHGGSDCAAFSLMALIAARIVALDDWQAVRQFGWLVVLTYCNCIIIVYSYHITLPAQPAGQPC